MQRPVLFLAKASFLPLGFPYGSNSLWLAEGGVFCLWVYDYTMTFIVSFEEMVNHDCFRVFGQWVLGVFAFGWWSTVV